MGVEMTKRIFIVYIYVIVFSFLGDFSASEIYVPTFRNTLSVSSSPIKMQ